MSVSVINDNKSENGNNNNRKYAVKKMSASIISNKVEELEECMTYVKDNLLYTDEELCVLLAEVYEDLKIKNVPLSAEMNFLVTSKLVDSRFYLPKNTNSMLEAKLTLENVMERIESIKNYTEMLVDHQGKDLDDQFMYLGKIIAQQMNILKRFLRKSYVVLPWEEMEFCLLIYMRSFLIKDDIADICRLLLDRRKLFHYLINFVEDLVTVSTKLGKNDVNSRARVPGRATVLKSVKMANPVYKDLYRDYEIIRDVHSLKHIDMYIDASLKDDTIIRDEDVAKLLIERTLQVIGEQLKNTVDSPNVSSYIHSVLMISAPSHLKDIIVSLRDSLSHAHTLVQRLHVEKNQDDFFQNMKNDLFSIQTELNVLLYNRKMDAVVAFLNRITASNSIEEVKELLDGLISIKFEDVKRSECEKFAIEETERIKKLIDWINELFVDKTKLEMELLKQIDKQLIDHKKKIRHTQSLYRSLYVTFKRTVYNVKFYSNVDTVKSVLINLLKYIDSSYQAKRNCFEEAAFLSNKLLNSLRSKSHVRKYKKVIQHVSNLCATLQTESATVRQINQFKENLDKDDGVLKPNNEKHVDDLIKKISQFLTTKENADLEILYENKKKLHHTKTSILDTLQQISDCEKHIVSNNEINLLHEKVKIFQEDTANQIKKFYAEGNISACKKVVSVINDSYSVLEKALSDHNIFISSKQLNALENFLAPLKLKKDRIDELAKKYTDHLKNEVLVYYEDRLKILKRILSVNNNKGILSILERYNKETQFQIIIQALLLDLLEILEDMSMLSDNRLFIDDYAPVLVGKALRNYLAHGNILLDTLTIDQSACILSNAFKLCSEGENLIKNKVILIGKVDLHAQSKQRIACNLSKIKYIHKLFDSVKQNKADDIETNINEGTCIFARDIHNNSLLHHAASKDAINAFQLLQNFLDLNAENVSGYSPFHTAIINGSESIFQVYLSNGFALIPCPDRSTCLHLAAKFGQKSIAQELLKSQSISINSTDDHKMTPLHLAVKHDNLPVVEFLLSKGADVRAKAECSLTPLHDASRIGQATIVSRLLDHPLMCKEVINQTVRAGNTALHYASENGHVSVVSLLLRHGSDTSIRNGQNKTALDLACYFGHLEVVTLLLRYSNTDYTTCNNLDPSESTENVCQDSLYYACIGGHVEIVKLLLETQQNINKRSCLLHEAISNKHRHVANLLIQEGFDVNVPNRNGETPLHIAAACDCFILPDLLSTTNTLDTVDGNNYTPLGLAVLNGHFKSVKRLVENGANVKAAGVDNVTPLHIAAFTGHIDTVKYLLDSNAEVEPKTVTGITPLHQAVQSNKLELAGILLEKGASVNVPNENGYTPLHIACRDVNETIVDLLIKNGADINAKTYKIERSKDITAKIKEWYDGGSFMNVTGLTPLHLAASNGSFEIASKLISMGADFDAADENGMTPLALASQQGHTKVTNLLISKGANVNIRLNDGLTPLICVAQNGFQKCLKALLLAGASVDAENFNGYTALLFACSFGHYDVVNLLLDYGADINKGERLGITPLHNSVLHKHKQIVKTLIKRGAEVNVSTKKLPVSPLDLAVYFGGRDIVKILVDAGAALNNQNNKEIKVMPTYFGDDIEYKNQLNHMERIVKDFPDLKHRTPLSLAASMGNYEILCDLISFGAKLNSADSDTLHMACLEGYSEIVSKLLQMGVDPEGPSKDGFTPLTVAVQGGHMDVVRILLDDERVDVNRIGSDDSTALLMAVKMASIEMVALILHAGAHVNVPSNGKPTPLYLACKQGEIEKVKLLLDKKADFNIPTIQKFTCLHAAAMNNHTEIVSLLLSCGADIEFESMEGIRPLHLACQNGCVESVETLLTNKAEINVKSEDGSTPLILGCYYRHENIVELLVKHGADVNLLDSKLKTPLHTAAFNGDDRIVSILLNANADVNMYDILGSTPLHLAVAMCNMNIVCDLLINGAKIQSQTERLMIKMQFEGKIKWHVEHD